MSLWLAALAIGGAAAALQYARLRAPALPVRVALGMLRALALAIVIAVLLDAPLGRARPRPPDVFVDASLSLTRGDSMLWRHALDSARAVEADSLWIFGDSVRPLREGARPADAASHVRTVVERTMSSGRPAIVISDGELGDALALAELPEGSRLVVVPRPPRRDASFAGLTAPRAAVEGDSIEVRLVLATAAGGAGPGLITLWLDGDSLETWRFSQQAALTERQFDLRIRAQGRRAVAGGRGSARVLRATLSSEGDTEPRNDTIATTLELSRAASAVFVSTSPDPDARFAIAVLRGTLALPTRGFYRVAQGQWRHEGTLARATEDEVRDALRQAPVAILHGDSAIFGSPRAATLGPLALLVPVRGAADGAPAAGAAGAAGAGGAGGAGGEWYIAAVPPSPLSEALAGLPLDSLPPVSAGEPAAGEWIALEARRGREATRRPIVVGQDAPRRSVVVTGSGFWRWRFRGGASGDAYAALWGGIFDWLAAERADRRAAVPDDGLVRAGQPVRWRRGAAGDSAVRVVLRRRGESATRADTIALRFPPGSAVQESPPLAAGSYDVTIAGGSTVLIVNASAELIPARARIASGDIGTRASLDDAPRARRAGWLYALAILLLCAEWVARRRAGLR